MSFANGLVSRSHLGRAVAVGLALVLTNVPGVELGAETLLVDPAETIRQRAHTAREALGTPGFAVTVVDRDGRPLVVEGFGNRDLQTGDAVDQDTRFLLGSSTKAFTATALGILADEGLLAWDRPVIDDLPAFRLSDDHATLHTTLRDLLAHRSGLATHPFVFYRSTAPRAQVVAGLRHLDLGGELRERFQYSNLGYLVAGQVGARAIGGDWEHLVRSRLLDPLGMKSTGFSGDRSTPDDAVPHRPTASGPEAIAWPDVKTIAAAGGVITSASDLVPWLRLQLTDGSIDDRRILDAETLAEVHSPQSVLYGRQLPDMPEIPFVLYGLGWNVGVYRGHRLLWHAGATDGFGSMVAVLPDDGYAVAAMANESFSDLPGIVVFTALDALLRLEAIDWLERMAPKKRRRAPAESESVALHRAIDDFAGVFEHPAYGSLAVEQSDDSLQLEFRGLQATLVHRGDGRFAVTGERALGGLWARFVSGATGEIDRVEIPFAPAVDPIVFSRVDRFDHGP